MISNKEYEKLLIDVINSFNKQKYKGSYDDILSDIKELDDISLKFAKKEKSHSSMMYEVRFMKADYAEELKEVIACYHEIIFKDFSYKNDLNALINGPYSLKIWLVRFMCIDAINIDLIDLIKEDFSTLSITKQYLEIDSILFKKVINEKVTI